MSVGGGGLISGIGAYLKAVKPSIQIVGCSPVNSPAVHESLKKGKIINVNNMDTLSDGTAGDMEEGSVTFPIC
jgi:threonine dehydratase